MGHDHLLFSDYNGNRAGITRSGARKPVGLRTFVPPAGRHFDLTSPARSGVRLRCGALKAHRSLVLLCRADESVHARSAIPAIKVTR